MRIVAAFLLLLAICAPFPRVHAARIDIANYTMAQANLSINEAEAYINKVNQSSFLIFHPNLSAAYGYLRDARYAAANDSFGSAVIYSEEAQMAASDAYLKMIPYRAEAFVGIVAFTVAVGLVLYRFMTPVRLPHKKLMKR